MNSTGPVDGSSLWNVVWAVDPDALLETEWIRSISRDVALSYATDLSSSLRFRKPIVIINDSGRHAGLSERLASYIRAHVDAGESIGLFHVSDEHYRAPLSLYEHVSFVVRIGHWSVFHPQNVLTLPIGLSSDFMLAADDRGFIPLKPARNRRFTWSFLGQLRSKPTRRAMLQSFARVPRGYVYETRQFRDPHRLPDIIYRELLTETIFSLCPRGWSVDGDRTIDSFRAYESAAAGAIPIVDSDYYARAFGAPFPTVRLDWADAPALVTFLQSSPERLAQLQYRCYNWWNAARDNMPNLVKQHICRHSNPLTSDVI